MRFAPLVGIIAVVAIGTFFYLSNQKPEPIAKVMGNTGARSRLVDVVVPELVGNAKIGEGIFNAKCATCHGENAAGTDSAGPPLVHKIYEPSHHADMAFVIAARNGVRSHHWPFGNMPPVDGITDAEVLMVVDYIRTLQRENGIG